MRILALAALTMVTALGVGTAQAQRLGNYPGASYPVPAVQPVGAYPAQSYPTPSYPTRSYPAQSYPNQSYPARSYPAAQQPRYVRQRWSRDGSGRWIGGSNAPGGWNAYHRPTRGYRLPHYWTSDSFFLNDYSGFNLYAPQAGYSWHRYYDDAVLLDSRGRVYDWASDVNWDGGYAGDGAYAYAEGGAGGSGYADDRYARDGYRQDGYTQDGSVRTYTTGGGVGGTTVVTVQGEPSVTTTTTTEYIEETRSRRAYRAPVRHYYRPVRTCGCRVARAPVRKVVRHRVWHRPAAVEAPVMGS